MNQSNVCDVHLLGVHHSAEPDLLHCPATNHCPANVTNSRQTATFLNKTLVTNNTWHAGNCPESAGGTVLTKLDFHHWFTLSYTVDLLFFRRRCCSKVSLLTWKKKILSSFFIWWNDVFRMQTFNFLRSTHSRIVKDLSDFKNSHSYLKPIFTMCKRHKISNPIWLFVTSKNNIIQE